MKSRNNKCFCDNCGKAVEMEDGFPYDKKWSYIYVMSFKTAKDVYFGKRDKGFCSPKCAGEYVQNLIKNNLSENTQKKPIVTKAKSLKRTKKL
jgi:hypothetical protein